MKAYKLFRLRKDGTLGPLFINRRLRVPVNQWLEAEFHPTKGYAQRKGWHTSIAPYAPHLSEKGRVWREVEIKDYVVFERPEHQGGTWFIAQRMKVLSQGD
jgi:hypothetical protein